MGYVPCVLDEEWAQKYVGATVRVPGEWWNNFPEGKGNFFIGEVTRVVYDAEFDHYAFAKWEFKLRSGETAQLRYDALKKYYVPNNALQPLYFPEHMETIWCDEYGSESSSEGENDSDENDEKKAEPIKLKAIELNAGCKLIKLSRYPGTRSLT